MTKVILFLLITSLLIITPLVIKNVYAVEASLPSPYQFLKIIVTPEEGLTDSNGVKGWTVGGEYHYYVKVENNGGKAMAVVVQIDPQNAVANKSRNSPQCKQAGYSNAFNCDLIVPSNSYKSFQFYVTPDGPVGTDVVTNFSMQVMELGPPYYVNLGVSKPVIDATKKWWPPGGCLIATATYGSELAPQVQQLRELRDNSLSHTTSGILFMKSFNTLYYSFSPTIADWERESPIFKEAVKITLTPLISSLSILNYVDMDSESKVIGYGISMILLNVGMYFVAPTITVWQIKKRI